MSITYKQSVEHSDKAVTVRSAKPFWRQQYFLVIVATALGAVVGIVQPGFAVDLKILGDIFISLVKMIIAPLIFLVVVGGVAHVGDVKVVGRLGLKAFIYFEIITTACMAISFGVARVVQPGLGVAPATAEQSKTVAKYAQTHMESLSAYLMEMVPDNFIGAFAKGELMQVLVVAVLTGIGLVLLGEKGAPIRAGIDKLTQLVFSVVHVIVSLAAIGAFGAMAFTVGKFGASTLLALAYLILTTWAMMAVFVFVVLGLVLRLMGISLFDLFRLLRTELVVVFGTSSSETAIPGMMEKLTKAGAGSTVTGLTVPLGYSFNMDGLALTLPISALFIAQVYGVPMSLEQQISLFVIILFTSKGAAGVTGGAFASLAATVVASGLPVEGLALLLGIDRFMSLGRALVNTLGNAVAALVVAKWDGSFDRQSWDKQLRG